MKEWQPVFGRILDSPLNDEPLHVRWLFVGMLLLRDDDHVVRINKRGLRKRANLTDEQVEDAIKNLSSPKPECDNQEFEGRMIEATPEGWRVLNGEKYANRMKSQWRRLQKNESQNLLRNSAQHTPKGNGQVEPPVSKTQPTPLQGDNNTMRLRRGLNRMFGRNDADKWTYAEETTLVQVSSRKDCLKELQVIGQYRETAEYPHKSVLKVLENWNTILDQAHSEGIEYREKFNVPTSERFTACGLIWNRTDGGPRKEQFKDRPDGDDVFELCRSSYDSWLKKCKPLEQAV